MLYKIIATAFLLILYVGFSFSQGLVIDHTCIDISQIPSNYIDSAKTNLKWHYASASHGWQLTCGLEFLEQEDPFLDFEVEDGGLPSFNNALCMYNGNGPYSYILAESYWSTEDGRDLTFETLESNPKLNVSMFVWCGECVTNDPEQTQAYLDSITSFEAAFPDVTFVYCTGNAQETDDYGYYRYLNNNIIRQYCIENNKVLYDFADLDCWYEGEFNYYIWEGDTIPLQHPAFNGPDLCGHVNELGNIQKGYAAWWMVANLAGWKRETSVNAKVYLEGPFDGTSMNNNLNITGTLPLSQPFNTSPWNYDGNESVVTIPNTDVVDWILVELRDAFQVSEADGNTIVGKRAGFLLEDGSIVDIDGSSPLMFNATINENLFIVIRNKSHLDIIGANPASLNSNTYNYDFSISESQVYGGMTGYKEIAPAIWGMIAGDGNGDGIIDLNDKYDPWLNQTGESGYKTADFDMSGKVDNQDKNDKWFENINKQSQIPD